MTPLGVKVDFVCGELDFGDARPTVELEDKPLLLDTFRRIFSNKLATLIHRNEIKDVIDFHFCDQKNLYSKEEIYEDAKSKEGLFDDPPRAGYQIAESLDMIHNAAPLWPKMLKSCEQDEAFATVQTWVKWIYKKGRKDAGLP